MHGKDVVVIERTEQRLGSTFRCHLESQVPETLQDHGLLDDGISVSFLNQARLRGDGPPFLKVGRRVLYRIDDVDNWLINHSRTSTSEER